ncbi:MAG TPA: succinylglutamate-semialdehyde dehydrogenase [Caulobacterales bacterium]|nr:succinylglutamate-semialdehyde dehydrogenase [Caulobacterales bacterium]
MTENLLIGGRWRAGAGAPFSAVDPAYGEATWTGANADARDVDQAVRAARAAFADWARTPAAARDAIARAFAEAIGRRGEDLARAISASMGKPLWESRTEVAAVIGKVEISIRMRAERAGERDEAAPFGALRLSHRPLGVMAVFGPFNFPAHLPNGHIVPALLAGNTIVFKPSELAPLPGAMMAAAWTEAGLPAGVFNLIQGGRETGAALLAHTDVNGVLFTGSAETGRMIHRQFGGKPDVMLALEMGGNNPLVVWPPASPAAAANLIAHSAWATSGQRCSCARRLILPADSFGDEVIERLSVLARDMIVAPWKQSDAAFMGPVVTEQAAQNAENFLANLIRLGGRTLAPLDADGAFLRPALVDMTDASDAPDEELFGPLLQIYRARTIYEAFARANATKYGLAGGLISDDAALWARAQQEMRAGVLNWNRPTTGASSALPFGGPGLSGDLRPSAAYAADYCAYPVASQIAEKAASIAAPGLPP